MLVQHAQVVHRRPVRLVHEPPEVAQRVALPGFTQHDENGAFGSEVVFRLERVEKLER